MEYNTTEMAADFISNLENTSARVTYSRGDTKFMGCDFRIFVDASASRGDRCEVYHRACDARPMFKFTVDYDVSNCGLRSLHTICASIATVNTVITGFPATPTQVAMKRRELEEVAFATLYNLLHSAAHNEILTDDGEPIFGGFNGMYLSGPGHNLTKHFGDWVEKTHPANIHRMPEWINPNSDNEITCFLMALRRLV